MNIPAVAGETAAGYQQTQNTAIAQQDLVSSSLSSGVSTLTVRNIISRQLPEQSENFDEVVLTDLAADYADRCWFLLSASSVAGSDQRLASEGS